MSMQFKEKTGEGFVMQQPSTAHHQTVANQKQTNFKVEDNLGLKQQPKMMVLFDTGKTFAFLSPLLFLCPFQGIS